MKWHILAKLRDEPWGGGNQFLCALKKQWECTNHYTHDPALADALLFNSYPFGAEQMFKKALTLKKQDPKKILIHRLDGPISLVRGDDQEVDKMIALFNRMLCDGIIFQSMWSQRENRERFDIASRYETVIHNAPDTARFNLSNRSPSDKKIRLIAASWSSNLNKGFAVYKFLDDQLDFSRYEMTFTGNSPMKFRRIRQIKPVDSRQMAHLFKQHDIFITASQADPCSNALIEALACGLPAVARNDGGHPELIGQGGICFEGIEDVLSAIDRVASNIQIYQSHLPTFDIARTAEAYTRFAQQILDDEQNHQYRPKRVTTSVAIQKIKLQIIRIVWIVHRIFNRLILWIKIGSGT